MNKKLALYLPKRIISDYSYENIYEGNPGIGGTEYLTVLLSYYLSISSQYDIVLFVEKPILFNQNVKQIIVNNFKDSMPYLESGDMYIITPFQLGNINNEKDLRSDIKYILWAHIHFFKYSKLATLPHIIACVFLTPNSIYKYPFNIQKKGIVIGNICSSTNLDLGKRIIKPNVVFLGAVVPQRGLGNLLNVWDKVVSKHHDAHLFICGSGNLYNRDIKLGEYGIAEDGYEKELMSIIREKNIGKNVTFLGNVSINKQTQLLRECSIGITTLRYSGYETFCLSAIELGSFGMPVIAANIDGLKTTLPKRCGFRVKSNKQLVNAIVKLLGNKSLNERYGTRYKEYIRLSYSPTLIVSKWIKLINDLESSRFYYRINFKNVVKRFVFIISNVFIAIIKTAKRLLRKLLSIIK